MLCDTEFPRELPLGLAIAMPLENGIYLLVSQLTSSAHGRLPIQLRADRPHAPERMAQRSCPDSRAARLAERFPREGLDSENAMRCSSARVRALITFPASRIFRSDGATLS
jgi:hypothetical protein